MKTPRARIILFSTAAATAFIAGCAVSPDYSHYDWATRGGMVEEQDRSLAGARIEPFRSGRRFTRSNVDEPLTPPGAPTAREKEIIIDPAAPSGPVYERRTTTVVTR